MSDHFDRQIDEPERDKRQVVFPKLVRKPKIVPSELEEQQWGAVSMQSGRKFWRKEQGLLYGSAFVMVVLVVGLGIHVTRIQPVATENQAIRDGQQALSEVQSAEQFLLDFVSTPSVEGRLALVRHPDVTEARMRKFYGGRIDAPEEIIATHRIAKNATIGGRDLIWINVVFSNGAGRTAVLERTDAGLKLDWESFVLYENVPWSQFLAEQSENSQVYRVNLRRDDYHNYRYADASRYLSFAIEDALRTGSCWGYAEAGSEVGRTIARLLLKARDERDRISATSVDFARIDGIVRDEIKIMIRLRFVPHTDGAAHSQAWIESVVSDSWFEG